MSIYAGRDVPKDRRTDSETSPKSDDRLSATAPSRLWFDRFTLDLERACLVAGEKEVALRPKTFDFLRYLATNPSRLVSKDELLRAVWSEVTVSDDSVVQCVTELRRALSDQDQRIIRTVRGRGYRFQAPISAEQAMPGRQAADASKEPNRPGNVSNAEPHAMARAPSRRFVVDARQVGRELNVRYLVEGSVRKAGDQIRLNARLVNAETGATATNPRNFGLIVTHEVTNSGSDRAQLANVAKQAKAVLETDELEAVADRGYFNGPEILARHNAGITVTLPKPLGRAPNRMAGPARRRTMRGLTSPNQQHQAEPDQRAADGAAAPGLA